MRKLRRRFADDTRTPEQIWEHYQLERRLADRLRNSTREERKTLYRDSYSTLYASLPHHPRHQRKASVEANRAHVESQMRMLLPFLEPGAVLVEIGTGDGGLTRAASRYVKAAYGIDVTVTGNALALARESNALYVVYAGGELPLASESVDVAFSSAVMEHLHPDDAFDQLKSIARVLVRGGHYVFYTPHKLTGPGDVSKYFDDEATGFHLKEYTFREVRTLLHRAGFSKVRGLVWFKGRHRRVPLPWLILNERLLALLPYRLRHAIASHSLMRRLVSISVAGTK